MGGVAREGCGINVGGGERGIGGEELCGLRESATLVIVIRRESGFEEFLQERVRDGPGGVCGFRWRL